MLDRIKIKVKRQDEPLKPAYWEEFEIPYEEGLTVADVLFKICENSINNEGREVAPVVWERCASRINCGSCTMIINGKVLEACGTKVDSVDQPIILEPLSRFPVVRDLFVDRKEIFKNLEKVFAWNEIEFSYERPALRQTQEERDKIAPFARCTYCGACLEACPQYNKHSGYMGALNMGQVHFFNSHPMGKNDRSKRCTRVLGQGGVLECGFSLNCNIVCPMNIPLFYAISHLGWEVNKFTVKHFLGK